MRAHRRSGPSGFTLVELLVVIGIIAILISILFPSLGKVRASARTVTCTTNLRQIGQAFYAYAADRKGYVVPKDWYHHNGAADKFRDNWAVTLIENRYLPAPAQDPASKASSGESVFRCPDGLDERWVEGTPGWNGGERSPIGAKFWRVTSSRTGNAYDIWYGVNGANEAALFGLYPMNACPPAGSMIPHLMKMGRIKRGSEVALVYDGLSQHFGTGMGYVHINARHNNRTTTNVLFCDGHVESLARSAMPSERGVMEDVAMLRERCPYPKWRIDQ